VSQHERVKKYWDDFKTYQGAVRKCLITANLIDNPDVPKKLSDALDFKGTCEEMCPDWEKVDRILSGRVDDAEKEVAPDGSLSRYPAREKMVKALARSAAGQEAPLPDEVRSAAALRRTVDYLFNTVLGGSELPAVYTFLWDRTRAIRRDFVFHSFMSKTEILDQVYCLEQIVRFHVIAAHQMSRDGVNTQGFSEQQELEQLGKSLLSLIHAYEDCSAQDIVCDNETEFRAYHILWGARSNPGILEEVQNWGWKFWGESEDIQLAVSLVEALQTPWDTLPLKPRAETDTAQNAFTRFFSIIEDKRVSYTMACFAETFFNHIRVSVLKTIVKAYRKPKVSTNDWTLTELNKYLLFDNKEDIVPFCEAHSLRFGDRNGVDYLSIDSGAEVIQPSPPLKQGYSHNIVERKRGDHSLPEAINHTLYDDTAVDLDLSNTVGEIEGRLFVKDNPAELLSVSLPAANQVETQIHAIKEFDRDLSAKASFEGKVTSTAESVSQPTSIFDRIPTPSSYNASFSFPTTTLTNSSQKSNPIPAPSPFSQPQPQPPSEIQSLFSKQPNQVPFSTFPQKTSDAAPSDVPKEIPGDGSGSLFSFLQQPTSQPGVKIQTQDTENTTTAETPQPPMFFQQPNPPPPFVVQPQLQLADTNASLPLTSQVQSVSHQSSPLNDSAEPATTTSAVQKLGTKAAIEPRKDILGIPSPEGLSHVSTMPSTLTNRRSKLTAVTNWVALGSEGLMDQFIESQVELILHEAARMFMEEETARIALEAEEQARNEADHFRYHSLATRYGRMWRENARLLWLKRKGRAARQARRELAESMRASKTTQSANIVEDFRASTTIRRRGSLESLLDATGVLDGVHNSNGDIRTIAHVDQHEPSLKRQHYDRSISSATSSAKKHRRGQSEHQNPLRRSLLSDPTYLHGGSRIHLISDYNAKKESRPQVSGVQTDYFRLKARGISTLPDGTPLANSAANNTVRKKRSLDIFVKPSTPFPEKVSSLAQSVPAKPSRAVASSNEDIQALKAKARAMMAEVHMSHKKRVYVDDDEELFERAKRVREQMDEGASWYRQEIERETDSRSVS
jgi:hypothetical protein